MRRIIFAAKLRTMNHTSLPALSPCYHFDNPDFTVKNLVSAQGDALVAEALPTATPLLRGATPVAIKYSPRLGNRIFMLSGRNLSVTDSSGTTSLGTLHGDFLTVADTGARLIFMTTLGAWILDYDTANDKISVIGARPVYPAISFRAEKSAARTAQVAPVTFKGSYTHWRGPLAEADLKAVSDAVADACNRCFIAAGHTGAYAAPVLAWYHLLDAQGRVVHRSSPVFVEPEGADAALQCDIPVNHADGSYVSTVAASLAVGSFEVSAVIAPAGGDSDWRDAVTAQVFCSRPLSRQDLSAGVTVTFAGTAAAPVLRVAIPRHPGYDSMITGLIDRLDEKDCDTYFIDLKGSGGEAGKEHATLLRPLRVMSAERCTAGMRDILARKPSADMMLRRSAPHGFSATTVCVDGDMVTWGDITTLRALPQRVSAWATAVAPAEPWSAVIRVTLDHGDDAEEILSYEESGAANAPVKLSPLLSYPHPSARLIEIEITRPAATTRLSVPLLPTAGGSAACVMTSSGGTTGSDVTLLPVVRRIARRHPGLIIAAHSTDPLSPTSMLEATTGSIVAITPASRSSSSWDFARRHLYLFGSGGIHAVAVSSALKAVSAHLIDSRSVASGSHVAWTPEGVYAVSARNLLCVGGSRAKVVAEGVNAGAIGWCGANSRLYCIAGATSVTVRSHDGSWHTAPLPGTASYSITGDGHRLLLHSATHMVAPPEVATSPVDIRWERRLRLSRRGAPLAISGVEVHLVSTGARLVIGLYGDNGSRTPSLIASAEVDGELSAPVLLPVIFPCPFFYFTVRIEGMLTPGSRLTEVNLIH